MMKSILLLLVIFISTTLTAQKNIELSAFFGLTSEYSAVEDATSNIKTKPANSLIFGITARRNLKNNFFVEVGALLHQYQENLALKQFIFTSQTNFIEALHIPIRIGNKIRLNKNQLYFQTHAGITPSFQLLPADGSSSSLTTADGNGNQIIFNYQFRELNKNFFLLLNLGAGLHFKLFKKVHANIGLENYIGTSKIAIADVDYKIGNGMFQSATATYKGSFLAYNLGFSYAF